MTRQQQEVRDTILSIAEEQVLYLKSRYAMKPEEIIRLYTGNHCARATYGDAISSIATFTADNAKRQGFLAS